ncbi:MAG TPA: LutB/LldF family L-lactate oxidation iron-sulfur protein [Bacteroidia bacterium]|jgi:L-lactate dehydrogenase complex protein LldF|nr:LutB/LldF family L-lactate oxidation iron-sulfur protein [Bacteroidia bacterium]HRG51900.1 LutB/LldF family L-lactate oxidation iron-sulfur protein [Bacteroidia bacterium]
MSAIEKFLEASENKAFDVVHRKTIQYNITQYDKKVIQGKQQFSNLELAKTRAAFLKQKAIDNLEKYLIEFEGNFTRRGGKVIWAQDAEEAVKESLQIMKRVNAKTVVKAKSMVTEEVDFNHALEEKGIESIETDLGEYIVQLRNEPPYHIVTPAMHLSKEDVAKTFEEKKNTAPNLSPEQVTDFVRKELRNRYSKAEVGVSGGNFLIADIGAVAVTENEGNGLLSAAFPKIQIAIVGIEKMIPSLVDLDLFWPLLSTHGTGQNLTVYNTIYTGPKQTGETDGPEEMYIILLDNGRTKLLAETEQRRALSCIRCGACLNACPVYQTIGGHAYGTTYSGPIGSIITPHFQGMQEFKHLSYASTLCGKCTEVCPVKIDIHKLLLLNRKLSVDTGLSPKTENWIWLFWKKAMLKRNKMDKGGAKIKNFMLKQFFKKQWGERRDLPKVAPKSFNQLWRERKGLK